MKKNIIRDGGSTAIYTVCTVYSVYTAHIASTVGTVYSVFCLNSFGEKELVCLYMSYAYVNFMAFEQNVGVEWRRWMDTP